MHKQTLKMFSRSHDPVFDHRKTHADGAIFMSAPSSFLLAFQVVQYYQLIHVIDFHLYNLEVGLELMQPHLK